MPTANVFLDRSILGLIRRTDAKTVCDYGCGDGALLKRLDQKTAHRLRLTGIDYFSCWAKDERPRSAGNVRFIDRAEPEYRRLVRKGKAFDLVVSTFALHHFRQPVAELAVLKKLLKPHGTLFLADFTFLNDTNSQIAKNLFSFLSEEFHAFHGKYHRHHYTPDEARSLIVSAGFENARVRAVTADIPARERKEDTASTLRNLARMRAANRKTTNALQCGYFKQRFAQIIKLVRCHGIDYSQLFAIIART